MKPNERAADDHVDTNPARDPIADCKRRNPQAVDDRGNVLLGLSENEMGDVRTIAYCAILPPEAFQDSPCEVSRNTSDRAKRQAQEVISAVIASGTCGRVDNPTEEDFYAGLRAAEPTATQNAAIDTWLSPHVRAPRRSRGEGPWLQRPKRAVDSANGRRLATRLVSGMNSIHPVEQDAEDEYRLAVHTAWNTAPGQRLRGALGELLDESQRETT